MVNFGCGQGHRAPYIFYLNPGEGSGGEPPSRLQFCWRLEFRNDAHRTLLDHLRDKLVRVKQSTTDGNEQTPEAGTTRIVADIGYNRVLA